MGSGCGTSSGPCSSLQWAASPLEWSASVRPTWVGPRGARWTGTRHRVCKVGDHPGTPLGQSLGNQSWKELNCHVSTVGDPSGCHACTPSLIASLAQGSPHTRPPVSSPNLHFPPFNRRTSCRSRTRTHLQLAGTSSTAATGAGDDLRCASPRSPAAASPARPASRPGRTGCRCRKARSSPPAWRCAHNSCAPPAGRSSRRR